MKHLRDLIFRNRFHALGAHFYSEFQSQGLENPTLVCSSADVVQQLGLHANEVNTDLFLHPDDEHGRYAFGQQPVVGLWNCNVLARALSPLIRADALRSALLAYEPEYLRHYAALMSASDGA